MLGKLDINNPGNIRQSSDYFLGEIVPSSDAEFKQFSSMAYGYRAMFKILDTYRNLYGLETIEQIITRYAPPSENDTTAYINAVSAAIQVPPTSPLAYDEQTTSALVYAMSRHENGVEPNLDEITQGLELAGTIEMIKTAGGISLGVLAFGAYILYINRKKLKRKWIAHTK